MRVLVACEFSGIVRDAFAERGHEAWSCDLLPSERPGNHHQGYLEDFIGSGREWDLIIAHPPCTYLCNSGVRWLHAEPGRVEKMEYACAFFHLILGRDCPRICVENPIPHRYALEQIGPYSQIIQPYEFGHGETKSTCLWLKGLPNLRPSHVDAPLFGGSAVAGRVARVHHESPGPDRWKNRSRTYEGIARAMAEQWG